MFQHLPSKWTLGEYLERQYSLDQLQLNLMKTLYSNCYKIHMEKKNQRKTSKLKNINGQHNNSSNNNIDQQCHISNGQMKDEKTLKILLEIVEECAEKQCWFPKRKCKEILEIGEEGWIILGHWMQPLFKKKDSHDNSSNLEFGCEICGKSFIISQALEKFLNARCELFDTNITPLNPFEKYVDIWSQHRFMGDSVYVMKDHAGANAFSKGFSNCTMTHFVLDRDLQGPNPKEPHILVTLLDALSKNTSIYSIDFRSLLLVHDSVVKSLCNLIRKKNLTRITISGLSLFKTGYSIDIVNALLEAPRLKNVEIYIREELDCNFRFLEHVPSNLLSKLAQQPFNGFHFSSYDFKLPIEYMTLVENMLKNKFMKTIDFTVENENSSYEMEYTEFMGRIGQLIESIQEFHLEYFQITNIGIDQQVHIMKHSKVCKKTYLAKELVKALSYGEHVHISKDVYLEKPSGITFSQIVPFFNFIVSLTLRLEDDITENDWKLISHSILDSPVLENLNFINTVALKLNNLTFSQTFAESKSNQLKSIEIVSDEMDSQFITDVIASFLDLKSYPHITKFIMRGEDSKIDFKTIEYLSNCIKNQEKYYPKGLKMLVLPEGSISDPRATDLLLKSLMYNQSIETIGLFQAALDNVDIFTDFIITNKTVKVLQLNYSNCDEEISQDLLCEDGYQSSFLKVFGAFQINWNIVAIDWFTEYYWDEFILGSRNYAGERFLVQRIMDRNKKQKLIDNLIEPILKKMKFSDMEIHTQ